jgi:hypothetical protein
MELPLDLQLDLLVDEELPEDVRAALLARLDTEPGRWRELSIRFLQRQVERRSVRELMGEGRVTPVDFEGEMREEERRLYRMWGLGWVTPTRLVGVAAGLLIATTSALVTVQVMRSQAVGVEHGAIAVGGGPEMIQASLPGASVGLERPVSVEVPVATGVRTEGKPWEFLGRPSAVTVGLVGDMPVNAQGAAPAARRSVVIQPDGSGNAVVIPVNTMPVKVY